MDILSQKLGKALAGKARYQAAFEANKGEFHSIGKVESKEENLRNIENAKLRLQEQEGNLEKIRDNIKQAGDTIQQGISQEKLREIERKERDNESQRSAADQEVREYINNLQNDKRKKKAEHDQLNGEVQRNETTLKSTEEELRAQEIRQQEDLKQRDENFKAESKVKEDLIQQLLDELNRLRNQIKDDKRKQEEMEERLDALENDRLKLAAELGRLDHILGEKDELDDTDLIIQKYKDNAADLKAQMAALDEQNRILDRELQDQKDLNEKDQKRLDGLKKLYKDLSADKFDLNDLQRQLADTLDREKKLFDNNLRLITELKELDSTDSSFNKRQSELEAMVNLLVDQNYLERKSRVLEKLIRELEDRLREKQALANEILRKLQRMDDLIRNPDETKAYGVDDLKQKVEKLLDDINKIRKEKDAIRAKKVTIEQGVVNKDIKEVNEESINKCLVGLRDLEQDIDKIIQQENDILVVDRLKKNFGDVEREVAGAFYKKDNTIKDLQNSRQKQLKKKLEQITDKALEIEETVLPDVGKIADDEDEIEILKNKTEILKEVKRLANEISSVNIDDNLVNQLNRIALKKDEPYELIEFFRDLTEIAEEVDSLEKAVNQLEKRLYDFEHNLKQFEVELKQDFYDDSIQEVKEQAEKIAVLEKQVAELDQGMKQIEDSIKQAQSSATHSANLDQINRLQDSLDALKQTQKKVERDKKTLENSGKVLKNDLDSVNLEKITPSSLEKFDGEIVKQKDEMVEQEKAIADALELMKKLKDNAEHIAFKRKADKRQDCKLKLKKFSDDLDDLDRLLREIQGIMEMLQKDTSYLKINEGSPIKTKSGQQVGDKEKDQDVAKQFKDLEKQQDIYNRIKTERDSLRESWEGYQKQFDSMTLDNSGLVDYERLHDKMENELADPLVRLVKQAQQQLDVDLKTLRDQIEFIVDKYKQKRALVLDCRKEEKVKDRDLQKAENLLGSMKLRVAQMERELLNQQSMNFKTNSEKKQISDNLIAGVQKNKKLVHEYLSENESQKDHLVKIVVDLNQLGNKIVTIDDLKRIYKQLVDIKAQTNFKDLLDELAKYEQGVEQFIKDLLGGSQYECERKLKEAEALLEKLNKKIMELNNGMNDFEMDVKKGVQMNPDDHDLSNLGQKLTGDNNKDRGQLKTIEDQKTEIKKALNNIKAQTASGASDANKLSASEYEDFIVEIEQQVSKIEKGLGEHGKLDENLTKRIEEWNKQLVKSGTKDAIIEDIEKGLKENIDQLADLDTKLKDIDTLLRGFEEVTKVMKDNPDYEPRQAAIKKLIDQTAENRKQATEMEKQRKRIQDQVDKTKQAKDKGLKKLNTEELQNLTKQCEENGEELQKLNKDSDVMLKELNKRRQKLADADILDNFKLRTEELNEIDTKNKTIQQDVGELEKIIVEANKVNPANASETSSQLKQIKSSLDKSFAEKEQLSKRLVDLRDKIKAKDLYKDDPYTFTPIINEIKDLRQLLSNKNLELQKQAQNIKFLKNKFGGVDLEKKFDQFNLAAADQKKRLADLLEDIEILKDLNVEFDGYTSDAQEEDFIERLGIDLRDASSKHKVATEESDQIADKIETALKNIQRRKDKSGDQELTSKEIEERATLVSQIEDQVSTNQKLVDDIEAKVNKNKKVFMSMQGKQKLQRRQQEVGELSKKLETFENQTNEIEADMKAEFNKIKLGDEKGQQLHDTLSELLKEIERVKEDYAVAGQQLLKIDQDVNDLASSSRIHQFDLLKGNIRVKKQILKCLEDTKNIRALFIQLKAKYDVSKPVKPTYKPAKGDEVDKMLGEFINKNGIPVPIKRLANGYYMFGTKKIYAKVINGSLVIRVGGGYMGIEEFMFYYGAQELNKMLAYQGAGDEDEDVEINLDEASSSKQSDIIRNNKDGKAIIGIAQMKKRLSPRAASPSANRKSPRAGSPRQGTTTTTTTTVKTSARRQ